MSLVIPVEGVTTDQLEDSFGAGRHGGRSHAGIDIFAPRGTGVVAAVSGTIHSGSYGDSGGAGGLRVWVEGDDGKAYYYSHLDSITVGPGDRVEAGQQLGTVGTTGNAEGTAPHLHFSINSQVGPEEGQINPYQVLQGASMAEATMGQPTMGGVGGSTDVQSQVYEDAEDFIQHNFPTFAWALEHEELGPLLEQAADEHWSSERIQGALQGTTWWQTTSTTAREIIGLQQSDPAEYQRRLDQSLANVNEMVNGLGLQLSESAINQVATEGLMQGWTSQQFRDAVIANGQRIDIEEVRRGEVGGDVAVSKRQLMDIAQNNLLQVSDDTITKWMHKIVSGERDLASFEHYARRMARRSMPFLEPFIEQGINPADALAPYQQVIAERLEIAPGEVNMMDTRFLNAMRVVDDGDQRLATIPEMQQNVREMFHNEWDQTNQAKHTAMEFTQNLAEMFGQRA